MIGTRSGSSLSIYGPKVGSATDDEAASGGGPTATRDATSNRFTPLTATEWTNIGLVAPTGLWLCQEASGNATDVIGGLVLTAAGTPIYQQAAPTGWSRGGWGFSQIASQRFAAAAAVGPNPSTTSIMFCAYVNIKAEAGTRMIMGGGINTTEMTSARVTITPRMQCLTVNVASTGPAADPTAVAGYQLIYVKYDRTNSASVVYTEQEKLVGTYAAGATDGQKGFGGVLGNSFTGGICLAWMRTGASAEMSDAAVKAEMQTLGATIPWT